MHHPISLRFLANLTITILLASNLVSAFHVGDLLHTLRSLQDAPAGSVALKARSSNLTAPATVSNGTAGSSHPDSTEGKEGGLGLGGLLHNIFGRQNTPSIRTTFKARNLNITAPAAVGSNGTSPAGSSLPDAAPEGGHGLGLSGLFHKIFNRHEPSITITTLNIRAPNVTVTPAGVSNGTTPSGASHPDATTEGDHGSLGLGGLLHKIFNRHNTPTVPGPLAGRNLNGTVLPAAVSNGTVFTESSHPDAATEKGQGLGLGGLLNKIFGRTTYLSVPVEPEDVDVVDGEVGMLMSLNRRVKRNGEKRLSREERRKNREKRLSREERRKNREKRRVRRAMSAATEAEKEERHVARSRVFRG